MWSDKRLLPLDHRFKGSLGVLSIMVVKLASNCSTLFILTKYLTWWLKFSPDKESDGVIKTVLCPGSSHLGENQASGDGALWYFTDRERECLLLRLFYLAPPFQDRPQSLLALVALPFILVWLHPHGAVWRLHHCGQIQNFIAFFGKI